MIEAMKNCEQSPGQSVYDHGVSVWEHIQLLLAEKTDGFRIPKWFEFIQTVDLHEEYVIRDYALFHDCGKPHCRTVDDQGRVHFLNHAEVSKRVWLESGGDQTVGKLIGEDMSIHIFSANEISDKLENGWSKKDSFTLLLAALAEIHSNAKMFGGIESDSFKMKFKKIERRGKQIASWYGAWAERSGPGDCG